MRDLGGVADGSPHLDQGYQVGSGLAESACKRFGTDRMKGTGMRWSLPGAQQVATLRMLAGGRRPLPRRRLISPTIPGHTPLTCTRRHDDSVTATIGYMCHPDRRCAIVTIRAEQRLMMLETIGVLAT